MTNRETSCAVEKPAVTTETTVEKARRPKHPGRCLEPSGNTFAELSKTATYILAFLALMSSRASGWHVSPDRFPNPPAYEGRSIRKRAS